MLSMEWRRQAGQAMTEFVVTASAVLIPAFLLLPMVGKLIDMKQASVQAARYASWEYTAWYSDRKTPRLQQSFTALRRTQLPVKPTAELRAETAQRFFSDTRLAVQDSDALRGWKSATANPLWTGPEGSKTPLYSPSNAAADITANRNNTPDPSKLVNAFLGMASRVTRLTGSVGHAIGVRNAEFSALSSSGYNTGEARLPVQKIARLAPFDTLSLTISTQAGVLSEGWNAGGIKHTEGQVRGLVPTVFFDNPVIGTIQNLIGYLAPEISTRNLRFGYVNVDAVPTDYLKDAGPNGKKGPGTTCVRGWVGLCEY